MKKITTLMLVFCCLLATAQESTFEHEYIAEAEVPALVKQSQQLNFPNGFVTDWFIERGLTAGDDAPVHYRSKFSEDGGNDTHAATYLPNGMLFFHSEFLQANNIPSDILIRSRAEYDAFEIQHADFITLFNPKREIYRVKLRDQALVQMAYYTIDGMPIEKNELPEELLVFKY